MTTFSAAVDENFVKMMTSGLYKEILSQIFIQSQRNLEENIFNFSASILTTDGLELYMWGSKASTSTMMINCESCIYISGLIIGLRPANERRRYCVMTSLIGWAQA